MHFYTQEHLPFYIHNIQTDMSWGRIYLIEVAEWFGYCNRCSTIEQVGNRTGTRRMYRHWTFVVVVMFPYIGLYLWLTPANHIIVSGDPEVCIFITSPPPELNFPVKFSFIIFSF